MNVGKMVMNKGRVICFLIVIFQVVSCSGVQKPMQEPVSLASFDSGNVEEAGETKETENAKAKESRAIEVNPSLYYNYLMAQIYQSQGDIEDAIKHYRATISFDPDSTMLKFDLATLYVQAGRLDEAKQECLKIIEIDPGHFHSHIILASIYSGLNNKEAAIEEYKTILAQDPNYEEVYIYLNSL